MLDHGQTSCLNSAMDCIGNDKVEKLVPWQWAQKQLLEARAVVYVVSMAVNSQCADLACIAHERDTARDLAYLDRITECRLLRTDSSHIL